jgi:hypothetical protein
MMKKFSNIQGITKYQSSKFSHIQASKLIIFSHIQVNKLIIFLIISATMLLSRAKVKISVWFKRQKLNIIFSVINKVKANFIKKD